MTPSVLLPDLQVAHLVSQWLAVAPHGVSAVVGWILFACGSFVAVRDRVYGTSLFASAPMVGASLALASLSAGLGLLLWQTYPSFARWFCVPYAMLAVAASVLTWALHTATRQAGRE